MSTSETQCREFANILLTAPEYLGLPHMDRAACKKLTALVAALDSNSPPEPTELEAAYASATEEAGRLAIEGKLTITLPEMHEPKPSNNLSIPDANAVVSSSSFTAHPAADIFPMLSDAELETLADDIKANGLRNPIVTYQSKVVDGRNRLEACRRAGIEPTFVEWSGQGSLVSWIMSVNLHRRHLSDAQRALVAAKAKEQFASEAEERRIANLLQNKGSTDGRNSAHRSGGRSAEKAAEMLNVSVDATKQATKILADGDESLVAVVNSGEVSLDAAAAVATLPKEEQKAAVKAKKVKEMAKKVRKAKAEKKQVKLAPNPEPETQAATEPEPVEVAEAPLPVEPEPVVTEPEYPLLAEAYEALDAAVALAREVNNLSRADRLLRAVVTACKKVIGELETERLLASSTIDMALIDSIVGPVTPSDPEEDEDENAEYQEADESSEEDAAWAADGEGDNEAE